MGEAWQRTAPGTSSWGLGMASITPPYTIQTPDYRGVVGHMHHMKMTGKVNTTHNLWF